jgi:hypothetical protein
MFVTIALINKFSLNNMIGGGNCLRRLDYEDKRSEYNVNLSVFLNIEGTKKKLLYTNK